MMQLQAPLRLRLCNESSKLPVSIKQAKIEQTIILKDLDDFRFPVPIYVFLMNQSARDDN